jgi:hypothetical protein
VLKLNGFLSAVGSGDVKEVIEKMQAMMDYQAENKKLVPFRRNWCHSAEEIGAIQKKLVPFSRC